MEIALWGAEADFMLKPESSNLPFEVFFSIQAPAGVIQCSIGLYPPSGPIEAYMNVRPCRSHVAWLIYLLGSKEVAFMPLWLSYD